MLKNRAQKTQQITKHDSKMAPKKPLDFEGNAYWGAFGGPNSFCDEKVGPSAAKMLPRLEK